MRDFLLSVVSALAMSGEAAAPPAADAYRPVPAADDALYRAFGGAEAVQETVLAFERIALADPRIAHTFEESDMNRFREKLTLQLCWLMGGPCVFDGFGMRESHQPLDIGPAEWGAMVEDFQMAMSEAGVPFRTQNKLLKILAPMRRDVEAD